MESRIKLATFLKRTPFFLQKTTTTTKKNINSLFSNFFRAIYLNKSKLSLALTTGIFLSYLKTINKNNNKLFCFIPENNNTEINDLEKRTKVIQHNANVPCEDRFVALKLKNLDADFLAVFDGHGGDSVSQYASEKMAKYFDSIYLELDKKNVKGEKTQEEIIKQALLDTFHKIVNFFLN
jgi:hypothetical protein